MDLKPGTRERQMRTTGTPGIAAMLRTRRSGRGGFGDDYVQEGGSQRFAHGRDPIVRGNGANNQEEAVTATQRGVRGSGTQANKHKEEVTR